MRKQARPAKLHSAILVFLFATSLGWLGLRAPAWAQADSAMAVMSAPPAGMVVAPPTEVRAVDAPNDHGHALTVRWKLSADDGQGQNNILAYRILRTPRLIGPLPMDSAKAGTDLQVFSSPGTIYNEGVWRIIPDQWDTLGQVPLGSSKYENRGGKQRDAKDFLPDATPFQYKVIATTAAGGMGISEASAPAAATGQIVHTSKLQYIGIPVVIFTALVLGFISAAKRGRELYIRPLAGIGAVDEAIGRATEMNRPILYVLGLGAPDDIATIASYTILSRVAKKVAEHRTELLVPCYDAVVMSIAQETVRQAYLDAGRPDEYKEDMVYFVTQEQFAYVAAVNGTMLRRQTATNFYLGVFYAESLILAETGSLAGSIQISGTDRVTQIPFFIVACDYTLIGEELYAASAYLGREPKLLGTLKAQDWAKGMLIAFMILGLVGAALQWNWVGSLFRMSF
ncbi:MAG: hypothetical protein HZB43_08485 [candidate division Zixibacteria bacterium]|nr:hypothetical protein [candidate division Zixibacteria bacterium]